MDIVPYGIRKKEIFKKRKTRGKTLYGCSKGSVVRRDKCLVTGEKYCWKTGTLR